MDDSMNIQADEPTQRTAIRELELPAVPGVIWLYSIRGILLQVVATKNAQQRLAEIRSSCYTGAFAYAVSAAFEAFESHRTAITRAKYAIQRFRPEDQTRHQPAVASQ
jgi:hypothetical protein